VFAIYSPLPPARARPSVRFGPVCCLILLTGATSYYAPMAASQVGPISALACLVLYAVSVASLLAVSCSDPGVVRSVPYSGLPPADATAGGGWRFCDLCR
jgi:hypothetical protein